MDKKTALEKLKEFNDKGCHLLIPTTQHLDSLSDQYEVIVESLILSGHPKDRDVYPHENGTYNYNDNNWKNPQTAESQKVRISKQGLNKLNILSGIMWSPTLCREIRDPNVMGRIAYEAVGGVRKPDGTPYFISKIYAMDIEVERQKLESQYAGKSNKDYLVNRDLLQKKSNIATLCESGAKNRVTREVLCLNNFYTVADLKKEFVMARIVPKLDLSDTYTKQRLIDLQLQALTGIYGVPESSVPGKKQIEYAAPIDIKLVEDSAREEAPPDHNESLLIDFQNADDAGQVKSIENISKQKGYDLAGYLKRARCENLKVFTVEQRTNLFKHILSLPDKTNDVPY
jgi:hypothetical protein